MAPAPAKPPASSARLIALGSSTAEGFPPVSATIRSRTWSSSLARQRIAEQQRASVVRRDRVSVSLRQPELPVRLLSSRSHEDRHHRFLRAGAGRRNREPEATLHRATAHRRPDRPVAARRADSASRLSTARPTTNRSGALPVDKPNAIWSACFWGSGREARLSSIGAQSWCPARRRHLQLGLHPCDLCDPTARRLFPAQYSPPRSCRSRPRHGSPTLRSRRHEHGPMPDGALHTLAPVP